MVSGTRNNVFEHKSIVLSGDIRRLKAVKAGTNPPQIQDLVIYFIPETLFLRCMMEIWSRKVSHAIPNEILHRMIWLVCCWLKIENPRGLSRDIWQDPRGYVESMNHGCHVSKISQDMTE